MNNELRLDSEYFQKKFLKEDILREQYTNTKIGDFAFVTDGQHGYHEIDERSNIHMLTAKNTKQWFADLNGAEPLAKWVDDKNKRSSLEVNDVILATRGTVGCCALVTQEVLPANIDQDIARINVETNIYIPEYILVYLNSKYGQDWMHRNKTGMVQQGLSLQKVRTIPIPLLSIQLQYKVKAVVDDSYKYLMYSQVLQDNANNILLVELGLKDWKPANENTSQKQFSDFLFSGRLDAEYYQPKYDDLFDKLNKYETKLLGQIANISKSIEPGRDAYADNGIPFYRVANLSKFGLSQSDIYLDKDVYVDVIRPKKDTILLSKDGSVGIAYKVTEDLNGITSGAILHLNIIDNDFLPDYLTLVLNSIIVKMQSERDAGGSVIQHWKPSEVEQVIIPKLSKDIQQQISDKVQESFRLRSESKRLLELVKTAVEVAIEQDEEQALKLLNAEIIEVN